MPDTVPHVMCVGRFGGDAIDAHMLMTRVRDQPTDRPTEHERTDRQAGHKDAN